MEDEESPCPACGEAVPPDTLGCPGCQGAVRWRVQVQGSPFRVKPIAARIAAAHGLGSDAISSSAEGVVFAGTRRAVEAMAKAACAEGHGVEPLAPVVECHRTPPRIWLAVGVGLTAAIVLLAVARLLIETQPPPDVPRGTGVAVRAEVADAALASVDAARLPPDAPPPPAFDPAVVARAEASTVHVNAGRRTATGVLVSGQGLVLTHSRAVGLEEAVWITVSGGRPVEGDVVAHRHAEQLAVVQIPAEGLPAAALFGEGAVLTPDTPLFAVVGRTGRGFEVRPGRVRSGVRWEAGVPTMTVDATLGQAAVGAPLFDAKGRLVGLATHVPHDPEARSLAQIIEFARQGDDAILAAPLYPRLPSEAYGAVLAERPEPPPPADTEVREVSQTVARLSAPTGVVFVMAAGFDWSGRRSTCPRRFHEKARLYCRGTLTVALVAMTADGRRPETGVMDVTVATRGFHGQHGVPVRDRGWRSHKPTDAESIKGAKVLGRELGVGVSVWSTHVRLPGHRVAELASLTTEYPPAIALRYGDHLHTGSFRLPPALAGSRTRRALAPKPERPTSTFSHDEKKQRKGRWRR